MTLYGSNSDVEGDQPRSQNTAEQKPRTGFKVPDFTKFGLPRKPKGGGPEQRVAPPSGLYHDPSYKGE